MTPIPSYSPLPGNRFPTLQAPQQNLSYEQWLAMRGQGSGYAAPQQAQPDYFDLVSKLNKESTPSINDLIPTAPVPQLPSIIPTAPTSMPGMPSFDILGGYNPAGGGSPFPGSPSGAPWAGAQTPGMFDLSGFGSAGNALAPVAGAVGFYDLLKNKRTGARGIGQGALSGVAAGSYFGPPGMIVGGIAGAGIGAANTLFNRETTRDYAKKNTKKMQSQFQDDPAYQTYVSGMREQYNSGPPDPSKPFAGKYGSWDEYKKAGLEASDLTGVKGNIETFGKDWTSLNFDQQKAVTQAIINAGLYNSKRGEVDITDQAKAKQLFNEVSQGGFQAAPGGALPTQKLPEPLMIPKAPARSSTSSPGIGKDGKRINYSSGR